MDLIAKLEAEQVEALEKNSRFQSWRHNSCWLQGNRRN